MIDPDSFHNDSEDRAVPDDPRDRLRLMLACAPRQVILMFGASGRIIMAEGGGLADLGLFAEFVKNRTVHEVLPPEPAALVSAHLAEALDRRGAAPLLSEGLAFELPLSGRVFSVDMAGMPGDQGRIEAVVAVLRDVTENRRAAEASRRSEAMSASLINAFSDSLFLLNAEGRVLAANEAAAVRLGQRLADLKGRRFPDLVCRAVAESRERHLDETFRSGRSVSFSDSAQGRHYDVSMHPVAEKHGRVTRVAVFEYDVTARRAAEKALADSEQRFRALAENMAEAVILMDKDGRGTYANPSIERLVGVDARGFLNTDLADYMDTDSVGIVRRALSDVRTRLFEIPMRATDGRGLWCEASVQPIWNGQGVHTGFVMVLRDVTERRLSEKALRQYARRLENLARIDRGILGSRSPGTIAQEAVTGVCEVLGCPHAHVEAYEPQQGMARVLATTTRLPKILEPGLERPLPDAAVRQTLARGKGLTFAPGPDPDRFGPLAEHGVGALHLVPLVVNTDLVGVLAVGKGPDDSLDQAGQDMVREMADSLAIAVYNARLVDSIMAKSDTIRAMNRRLAKVEELERRRLAADLHDCVGQDLTALSINLNLVAGTLSPEHHDESLQRVNDALFLVEKTVRGIRDIMAELRPPVLDDYGLAAALRWHADQFGRRTNMVIHVRADDQAVRPAPEKETVLFRIAAEAVNNAAKHSGASRVDIGVETGADTVCLTVEDNGSGFDPQAVVEAPTGRGWGLATMRERAEAEGGRLVVDSAPGAGTRVTAILDTGPGPGALKPDEKKVGDDP